jgi:hypothetical protein
LAGGARSGASCRGDLAILRGLLAGRDACAAVVARAHALDRTKCQSGVWLAFG